MFFARVHLVILKSFFNMLKDIHNPVVDKIIVAVVRENEDKEEEDKWSVYLINLYDKKIETIIRDVFGLNNEYWVSFYIGKDIYDKKYIFLPESIREEHLTLIPHI